METTDPTSVPFLPSNRLLHYGSVARRVAVLQKVRSCARRHAVCRPKLSGATSASMVHRHMLRGLPRGRRQSLGAVAAMARLVSEAGSERAICPKNSKRRLAMSLLTGS